MKPHIKVQHDIKAQSEETMSSLQDIYSWQKEMKEKEKARLKGGQTNISELPDVRKNIEKKEVEKTNTSKVEKTPNVNDKPGCSNPSTNLSKQNEGDMCKEKGNNLVKLNKFDEALYFYTAAINHFDKEPIYFANRALCYLKLEKYQECIQDCNQAINLNKTNIKAHYRRMQAYEFLGKNEEALINCKTVLNLDPKNTEAKKSYQRIFNRIKKTEAIKEERPNFSSSSKENIEIEMYNKPAHLRSKKMMKNIKIKEVIGGKPQQVHISDEVLDKLFTHNNIGSYEEIKRTNKIQDKASIHDINMDNIDLNNEKEENSANEKVLPEQLKLENDEDSDKIKSVANKKNENKISAENQNNIISPRSRELSMNQNFVVPTTSAQFYCVWKELDCGQRYTYLKMISVDKLNKTLGAGLEPDTITDIFVILNEYYLKDNLEIIHILKELTKHDEFKILSMFLSKDDRDLMKKFVDYMNKRNNNVNDIKYIQHMYYLDEQI